MKSERLIVFVYLGITILAILSTFATTATAEDIVAGLVYMWICYFFYYCAIHEKRFIRIKGILPDKHDKNWDVRFKLCIAVLCVVGVVYAIKIYTGNMPADVLYGLKAGKSLYTSYQMYFMNNNLAVMSLKKAPAILANILVELMFIYSYINVFIMDNRKLRDVILLGLVTISKVYFGVSRGTNFEMFEIAFILIYCFWVRKATPIQKMFRISLMAFGVLACVVIFKYVLIMRGGNYGTRVGISTELYTDVDSSFSKAFPEVSALLGLLASYFSFGTYVVSYYFKNCLFETVISFLTGVIPFGNIMLQPELKDLVDVPHLKSACWTPDVFFVICGLGILGGPIVFWLLGNVYKRLSLYTEEKKDIWIEILKFFVIYELFSMPVGNFVWISSAIRMALIIIVGIVVFRERMYIKKRL